MGRPQRLAAAARGRLWSPDHPRGPASRERPGPWQRRRTLRCGERLAGYSRHPLTPRPGGGGEAPARYRAARRHLPGPPTPGRPPRLGHVRDAGGGRGFPVDVARVRGHGGGGTLPSGARRDAAGGPPGHGGGRLPGAGERHGGRRHHNAPRPALQAVHHSADGEPAPALRAAGDRRRPDCGAPARTGSAPGGRGRGPGERGNGAPTRCGLPWLARSGSRSST